MGEIFLFRKIKGEKRPAEQNEDSDTSSSHSSKASSSHSQKKIMKMQHVSLEDHFGYTYPKDTSGVVTVQFTNNSSFCWLNAAITATCWALKSSGVLNPIRGPLPTPNDGILAALLSWSQLDQTTIVNS